MPHVSRRHVPERTQKLIDEALVWVFSRLTSKQINFLFSSLLTPTERTMLAKRLGILFLIQERNSEVSIAEILKVSQPTVARIKLQHQLVSSEASQLLLNKLASWHNFTVFKNAMKEAGLYILKKLSRGMAGRI